MSFLFSPRRLSESESRSCAFLAPGSYPRSNILDFIGNISIQDYTYSCLVSSGRCASLTSTFYPLYLLHPRYIMAFNSKDSSATTTHHPPPRPTLTTNSTSHI